jgi:ceramide glucosyltransferase
MMTVIAKAFIITAIVVQFASIAAMLVRMTWISKRASRYRPGITILRPLCGLEDHIKETLTSTFTIDYPEFEAIFCIASPVDPVIPLIERLMAAHPQVPTKLLIGDDRVSPNPKLNNLVKGWKAATHDFIAMADSNLLLPPDYLDQLVSRWDETTFVVSSPSFGGKPAGVAAELECAFLNSYQARWQFAVAAMGTEFAHGKTLFWRRTVLERAGGLAALASEPAEDAAATKIARKAGLRVRLVAKPFEQPLGQRSLSRVWQRQLRWARLRRDTFGGLFAVEILSGGVLPLGAAAALAFAGDLAWTTVGGLVFVWYGAEILLTRLLGWPLSWRAPVLLLLRDLLLPGLWLQAWVGHTINWQGKVIDLRANRRGRAPIVL